MSTPDPSSEDTVSIISFDDELYLEGDYALPGAHSRIQHWLSQQCRFALEANSTTPPFFDPQTKEKEEKEPLEQELSSVGSSGASEERADSPLLGFKPGEDDERTLMDPLHFPSPTYIRDLPGDSTHRKHSPQSSHSSNTSSSRHSGTFHARSQSTSSKVQSPSRRPSLLRQPSLPLLGEIDEPQVIPIVPKATRSRAQSNASICSYHLPTSMQISHQIPPPITPPLLTPVSPPPILSPMGWRQSRISNTPPISSTLASFQFGPDDVPSPGGSVRPPSSRPHSQLHHHQHSPRQHNNQPSLSIPPKLSRSSSTLSLSLLTNNRNAVYIDDLIDVESEDFVDVLAASVMAEAGKAEGLVDSPLSAEDGVYFNALGSASQLYLGTASPGTKPKRPPTRPPPAPPLDVGELGGLGGVGVVDEDALFNTPTTDEDQGGARGVYAHHPRRQHVEFEEPNIVHHESDFDADVHDADAHLEGEAGAAGFMSRWSLTSSIDEDLTSSSAGGGGLFGSRKRKSWAIGGDKEKEKEKIVEKEKGLEKEKEKEKSTDKKRGRLVSFISRISSNIAPPPLASNLDTFETNPELSSTLPTLGFWFGDFVPPPLPMTAMPVDVGAGKDKDKDKKKNKDKKDKKGKKGKDVVLETELEEKREDREENDRERRDSLPPLPTESAEVLPPVAMSVPVMADANSTIPKFKANEKAALLHLRVDTGSGTQHHQPQPQPLQSAPISSPTNPPTSSLPFPDHQSSTPKGLKPHVASPIIKAFSEGFEGAGSALDFMGVTVGSSTMVGGGASAMGVGMRVRSSSAADLLSIGSSGGSGGGEGGYFDSYHHQGQYRQSQNRQYQNQHQNQNQHQYHYQRNQQPFGQPGQQQQGQVQGQGPARRYASAQHHPHPQSQQSQHPQQGYSSESPQHQLQFEEYNGQLQPRRQSQSYVRAGALKSPTVPARRPGLVKSVSTPMLNVAAGYGYGGSVVARRDADLPPTPTSTSFEIHDQGDDEEDDEDEGEGDKEVQEEEEEEEEDYGVETSHGQWRGGVGLAFDSDREREMTTTSWDSETGHEEQPHGLEEHSTTTTPITPTTTTTTTTTYTPRVSTETRPSSGRTRSGSTTIVTKTQEQMPSLVNKKQIRMNSLGKADEDVGVDAGVSGVELTPTPTLTPTVKTVGSSKGFRGFVERMRFTAAAPTNSSSSSLPSMVSASSTPSLSATTMAASTHTSLSSHHSPTDSSAAGINAFGGGGGSDGLSFLNDSLLGLKKTQKKLPKRKLVINGVSQDDVKGYEAVKAWCESFGEVREMKRTPDGYLHVDFRKASVAETVCRLKTRVFIKGAGSVSLSWYTKESKRLLL